MSISRAMKRLYDHERYLRLRKRILANRQEYYQTKRDIIRLAQKKYHKQYIQRKTAQTAEWRRKKRKELI